MEKLKVEELGQGFYRVTVFCGFMESPCVPKALSLAYRWGLDIEPTRTSYILGRETLLTTGKSKMMPWRKSLFVFMSRNALMAPAYFNISADRAIEIGVQIEL